MASYQYDGLGRRSLLTRGNGTTQTPGYDTAYNLSSLAQTASNSGYNQTYAYTSNALGQSLSRTGSNAAYQWAPIAPGAVTLTANGLNQYTSVGGTSFSYDGRGNLTSDGSRSYGFDVYNRLTGVSGAGSMSLAYDPAGRLFETAASGSTTRFLYDGANLIGEYDASGNLLRRYVQGAGSNEQLVWYEGSGTSDRRYLIQNELGTVVAADGPSGVTTYSYDEYGNPNTWNGPAPAPRFRYAGAIMLPEAQLYSMRARVYSPSIGRFLQTDPILFNGGMNLYAYTGNDPVNAIDPSGLEGVTPITLPNCKLGEDCDISHQICPDWPVCETVVVRVKAVDNDPKLSHRPQSVSLPTGSHTAPTLSNLDPNTLETITVTGKKVTNRGKQTRGLHACSSDKIEVSFGIQGGGKAALGPFGELGAIFDFASFRYDFLSGKWSTSQGANGYVGILLESYEGAYGRTGAVGRNVQPNKALANQPFSSKVDAFSGFELQGAFVFGFDLRFGDEFTAAKCENQ